MFGSQTPVLPCRAMRVATHPGNFHADDVFAIAVLGLVHGPLDVVRTRDEEAQDAADLRVDVGGRSDPATGDFDHHQKGGAGERPNGIRYASLGLVWRAHGEELAGGPEAAAAIDERLVQGIDANDTGQTIAQSLVDDIRPMSVSGVVAAMNPVWDEQLDPAEEDARFAEAVAMATRILERELAGAAAFARASGLVDEAIAPRRRSPGDRARPQHAVARRRRDPRHRSALRHLPQVRRLGHAGGAEGARGFDNRRDLPVEWAGLSGADLAEATGVDDAVFCHPARFYASARTREGITALGRRALDSEG